MLLRLTRGGSSAPELCRDALVAGLLVSAGPLRPRSRAAIQGAVPVIGWLHKRGVVCFGRCWNCVVLHERLKACAPFPYEGACEGGCAALGLQAHQARVAYAGERVGLARMRRAFTHRGGASTWRAPHGFLLNFGAQNDAVSGP